MSSLSAKDRVSLCSLTFSDGRRCRTPRLRDNPRFCPYHAQKEARARAAQSLGKDLDYFFSGDYLSACDLTTALGRLIPAVLRGDVKPRAARTVAYLAQTLMQAIHLSKHEYINAFGTDHWRQSIRNSVRGNYDYRFPPAPKPGPPASPQPPPQPVPALPHSSFPQASTPSRLQPSRTPLNCHSGRSDERPTSGTSPESYREESAFSSSSAAPPPTQPPQSEIPTLSGPAPSPRTPLPPTSAEFAQHLLAGRNLSQSEIPPAPTCPDPIGSISGTLSGPSRETGAGQAPQPSQATQPATSQTPSPIPIQATPAPASTAAPATPSKAPQPAPAAQPFVSLALPLPVRRRLHRAPA